MPLSDMLMSIAGARGLAFWGLELFVSGGKIDWLDATTAPIHKGAADYIILALVSHIAGILKHKYIDKDRTLSRMLG